MAGMSSGGYEKRDVSIRGGALLTLGILVVILLVLIGMKGLFDHLAEREKRSQPPPTSEVPVEANRMPPEPRLQMSPVQDYRKVRAEEDWALEHYAWVDRSAGKVRIPIARAIDLLAERGLPQRADVPR